MTSSVDMCGDGSSRHSVGTHGVTGAPVIPWVPTE